MKFRSAKECAEFIIYLNWNDQQKFEQKIRVGVTRGFI